ncbi:MAG: PQQ-binding-like beta-propeller repeat protein, partial [Bryobacteraceae bacterium]
LVALTANEVIGADPATGARLWQHPHKTDYGLAVSMPVWAEGNILVVSSSYNAGTRGLHLSRSGNRTNVKQLWHNTRVVIHFSSIVRIGDILYSSSGHSGPAPFTALNVKTGEIVWQSRDFAKANFVFAEGKLFLMDQEGNLGLATPSPQGLKVHAKLPLLEKFAWTLPTLAGTKLYLRDRKTILALDVAGRP